MNAVRLILRRLRGARRQLLLAFGVLGAVLSAPLFAETPVTLQLRWQHQFQFAGFYAALEKGYYRDAGMAVSLREGGPGLSAVDEVLAGRAQFGVANGGLVMAWLKGKPVLMVAPILQHSPTVLLALRDAGNSPAQLASAGPIELTGGYDDAELLSMFANEGIDAQKMRLSHSGAHLDDLIAGRVSAINAYATNEPFVLRQRGIAYSVLSPRDYGVDHYGDTLFTAQDFAHSRPELVAAFRQASLKGWEYALAHSDEIIELILARYNTQGKTRDQLEFEALTLSALVSPDLVQIGHSNPARWQHIADTFVRYGLVTAPRPLDGFYYEANAQALSPRVIAALAAALCVIVLVGGFAAYVSTTNRRLRRLITDSEVAKSALAESEAQFRVLAETSPSAIFVLRGKRVVMVNPAVTTITGYARDELLAMTQFELIHPDDRVRVAEINRARQRGEAAPVRYELKIVHKDGTPRWLDLSAGMIVFHGEQATMGTAFDVTERRLAADALRHSEERHRLLADHATDVIWTMGLDGRFTYVSPSVEKLRGYTVEEVMRQTIVEALTPPSAAVALSALERALTAVREGLAFPTLTEELEQPCKDGTTVWTEVTTSGIYGGNGSFLGILGITRDISERRSRERSEREFNRFHQAAARLATSNAALRIDDIDHGLCECLKILADFLGATRAYIFSNDLVARTWSNTHEWHADDVDADVTQLRKLPFDAFPGLIELFMAGQALVVDRLDELPESMQVARKLFEQQGIRSLILQPMRVDGVPIGFVGFDETRHERQFTETEQSFLRLAADNFSATLARRQQFLLEKQARHEVELSNVRLQETLAAQKRVEDQIRHMAQHDALTNLPNRALFSDRLQQAIAAADREERHLALLFIDLDRFKPVNDGFGHRVGDLLLQEAARRMQDCIRESDTVARIGGDEFVVLLRTIDSTSSAQRFAEKIRLTLSTPFIIDGREHVVSSSIGVAVYPQHGTDELTLAKNADTAMYAAKNAGRDRQHIFVAADN